MQSTAALPLLFLATSCAVLGGDDDPPLDRAEERAAVEATIERLHVAASEAEAERYFSLFDPEAVYFGTASEERWSVEQFRAFAAPYFDAGSGWTYEATERNVFLSEAGDVAWFDERLWNDAYGETRGTGVLVREGPPGSPWRFTQYNLAFPVPNDLARDLVERIRAYEVREGGGD